MHVMVRLKFIGISRRENFKSHISLLTSITSVLRMEAALYTNKSTPYVMSGFYGD